MNQIAAYFTKAADGIARYGTVQRLLILFFAILMFAWLSEKKEIAEKQNRLLVYSLLMSVVLLIPVTAMAVMIYQTAYYDYEWSWSMVPVTAVTAYGIVLVLSQKMSQKKRVLMTAIIVCILCLSSNLGRLQKVPEEELLIRMEVDGVLDAVYEVADSRETILWGPSELMQTARRRDGNIRLIYGRDMWDEKAGAYDYEAYSSELTQAYLWMEEAMNQYELAADSHEPINLLSVLDEQNGWNEETGKHVEQAVEAGVNTIILPTLLGDYIEESMKESLAARNKEVKIVFAGEYSIYRID